MPRWVLSLDIGVSRIPAKLGKISDRLICAKKVAKRYDNHAKLSALPKILHAFCAVGFRFAAGCRIYRTCVCCSTYTLEARACHLMSAETNLPSFASWGCTATVVRKRFKRPYSRYDGVHEVEVDFNSGLASVLFDDSAVVPDQLMEAVNAAGYRAVEFTQRQT